MLPSASVILGAIFTLGVSSLSLQDVCTTSYVQASLPSKDLYLANGMSIAITIDPSSVVATPVTNASFQGNVMYPDTNIDFCDITFAYAHTGRDDQVLVRYWMPTPDNFENRYLSTGGGGYAINSGNQSLPGGVQYGAVSGATDGGFGDFSISFDKVWLLENGTQNWESLYMFGYHGIHEMTILGQLFTAEYYNMSDTKLYSYYQGCSEGGREGWSQVQRFVTFDGVITGAPAFRFAHQQVQHLYSNVVEQAVGYSPPPCELQKILNETIAFCDPLDGKADGVVARTDLCKTQFDINSTIGLSYSCPAQEPTAPGTSAVPAQNGTVTAQGAEIARIIIDGLRDSSGRRAYFSYQPSSTFYDALTQANPSTGDFELSIQPYGGEFVAQFLRLLNETNLSSLDNVTYNTLVQWMKQGWQLYEDSLQTTWPDLTAYAASGGKILHYHGESDFSIPTASSVHYYNAVRQIMYPSLSYNDSVKALDDWYRLFLIPGASHCAANAAQPNAPFPQTNLEVLIQWVEQGLAPEMLNATVLMGENVGKNEKVCRWPLRPYWGMDGELECRFEQESVDAWDFELDAFKMPVY